MADASDLVIGLDDDIDDMPDTSASAGKANGKSGDDTPKPKAKPNTADEVKLPRRLLEDAEDLGISEEDVKECQDANELRDLISDQRKRIAFNDRSQRYARGQRRDDQEGDDPPPAPKKKEPPPEEEEDKYEVDKEEAEGYGVDARIKADIKRIGGIVRDLKKAISEGKIAKVEALEKKLEEAHAELAQIKSASNPQAQAAVKTLAKYPHLFGKGGKPSTRQQRGAMEDLLDEMFVREDDGKGGLKIVSHQRGYGKGPTVDIPKAVAKLWGEQDPDDDDDADVDDDEDDRPVPKPKRKPHTRTRSEDWEDAGVAVPGQRNGAKKTGKPGGMRAAERKVGEYLRKRGINPGPEDDDEELDF